MAGPVWTDAAPSSPGTPEGSDASAVVVVDAPAVPGGGSTVAEDVTASAAGADATCPAASTEVSAATADAEVPAVATDSH